MGVKGLWTVVSNSGRPTALETLEQKVLSIDISIWLYQAVHGMRGLGGSSVANSHLLILFHRICKLLFYKIKPVFVFDGGVPQLKKQTMATRRLRRDAAKNKAQKVRDRLLNNLLKSQAVRDALGIKGRAPTSHMVPKVQNQQKDLFELPPLAEDVLLPKNGKDENREDITPFSNIHEFTPEESSFKSLPLQMQHEIMFDLKDTRKENSWGSINDMPQEVDNFAQYQMSRLLKRKQFQDTLEDIQSKIQVKQTKELEAKLLGELEDHVSLSHRIVSEDSHSILAKKQTVEEPPSLVSQSLVPAKEKFVAKSSADFLSEFSKHGLIDENLSGEQDVNSVSSDEEELSQEDKYKLEQMSFLKAVDVVLDENDFSQEEILRLIEKSKDEVENQSSNTFDPSKPSTSKQFLTNNPESEPVSSSSSDDDSDDMIDVPMELDEPEEFPSKSTPGSSNLESIKKAKTQSLYLKIIQQQLEDNEQADLVSSAAKKSPLKKSPKPSIPISFDASSAIKSDIFSDIFDSKIPKASLPLAKNKNDSLKQTESKEPSEVRQININEQEIKAKVDKLLKIEIEKVLAELKTKKSPSTEKIEATVQEKTSREMTKFSSPNKLTNSSNEEASSTPNHSTDKDYITTDSHSLPEKRDTNDERSAEPMKTKEPAPLETKNSSKSSSSETSEQFSEFHNIDAENGQQPSSKTVEKPLKYSSRELSRLEANLMSEQDLLIAEMSKMDRQASSLGDQKYREAQELLHLFGIPFIVAPMEAEAQCAFLETIGLTHGTITDDSDVFLFGGKSVYRNFFNNNKYVELFTAQNLEGTYGLNRSKLIQMALLTGSDYTLGIDNVGAVLAMEIISEFPGDQVSGLEKLKKWWKQNRNDPRSSFGSKVKQRVKQLHFPEAFPSQTIYDAYVYPDVDESSEKFSWNVPDVKLLTQFAAEKFGWNSSKCSEILIPVIKKLGMSSSQTRIDNYFSKIALAKEPKHSSKRLLEAVARSKGEALPEELASTSKERKRKAPKDTQRKSTSKKPKPVPEFDSPVTESSITKQELKEKQFKKLYEPQTNLLAEREAAEKEKRRQHALSVLRKQISKK